MAANFQSLIQSRVNADPLQAGEFRGAFSLVGRIMDGVKSINVNLDEASKRQLKDAALAVYDVVARVIDIPILPDSTEQSIEAWLRSILEDQLDLLLGLEA
jgi:hypothetical protein